MEEYNKKNCTKYSFLKINKQLIRISSQDFGLWFWLVILTFPHLNPEFLEQFSIFEITINAWRMVSFLCIVCWWLLSSRKVSFVVFLIFLQQALIVLTTFLHNGAVYNCIASAFSIISIILLYDLVYLSCKNGKLFLSSQLFCFEVVIYINLLTEILFPAGMYAISKGDFFSYRNWFLGYYNKHTMYFVPALLFAWLYYFFSAKKCRTFLLTGAIFISAFLVGSGGVIISLISMAIVYVFFKNRVTLFHYFTYWFLHIIFFVFFVYFHMQNVVRWLLGNILGKWNSLIIRIQLWDRYKKLVSRAFFFGYGQKPDLIRRMESGFPWGAHAHNLILEILYQGGITNLLLFFLIVVISGKRVYKLRDKQENKIISIAFLGWIVATFVEPFMSPFLMGMFIIAYRGCKGSRKISSKKDIGIVYEREKH